MLRFAFLLSAALAATSASADPQLGRYMKMLDQVCIQNAPEFSGEKIKAAFKKSEGLMGPNTSAVLTGTPGKNCRIYVRGSRPPVASREATNEELKTLYAKLAQRLGAELVVRRPGTPKERYRVKSGRTSYYIRVSLDRTGFLHLSVN
ncbi:hypothetical protein [Leisingera sp. F5]|uniref:hypothetical protein n=1 Tax=Leisingera sp. F5 TaxID=1813816 RepID=UPI000A4CC833|nr:hypothetical protein [Leisingera sp. F5]